MSGTRWLDDQEQRAWRAFIRMHGRLTARLNRQLQADSGLSLADYEVLVQLTDAPDGRLRPFELQRDLQWEQSRLSHHLTRMQRRGLVAREECDEDGRGALIALTDEGRRAIVAAAPGHVETVRRLFFEGLTRDQLATLRQVSDEVLARLDTGADLGG
ncbi:MarR family winged helix-turn-helix transcriptional regulator [Actinoallomurus soli]|uniref:MarR family winged helix-turn-helix transcriptional regulator n=1 Tax=Actinoallomurus soli TaxID=2952535 RepID=UPI00209243FF|nr:MarR family transcriptional regulator [Actinoallomurus soli]MCO5967852.1 MarR family transcriptional regulator [Actinoallomurus soli]